MTYNFNPDLWLENQLRRLQCRLELGEIDDTEFREESLDLDRRYEEMVQRLDGTYEIPGVTPPDRQPR